MILLVFISRKLELSSIFRILFLCPVPHQLQSRGVSPRIVTHLQALKWCFSWTSRGVEYNVWMKTHGQLSLYEVHTQISMGGMFAKLKVDRTKNNTSIMFVTMSFGIRHFARINASFDCITLRNKPYIFFSCSVLLLNEIIL